MTQKSYATGSEYPPLQKDLLRVYSMRFCPYANRTRLVLAHKGIPHEIVNINLKQKPEWYLERNPLGMVPTVEKGDLIVYDSAICNDYLDEVYPQKKLTPSDPYTKARHRMIAEHFNKVIAALYAMYRAEDKTEARTTIMERLDPIESFLKDDFFGGKDVAMIDLHLWPFFERFGVLTKMAEAEVLPKERFPKLAAYRERMWQQPAVKATSYDTDSHMRFVISMFKNNKPDYDFGL